MSQENTKLCDFSNTNNNDFISTLIVGGNDTYGITGIPSTVGGRGVVQRAGLAVSTRIVYLGLGRGDA